MHLITRKKVPDSDRISNLPNVDGKLALKARDPEIEKTGLVKSANSAILALCIHINIILR